LPITRSGPATSNGHASSTRKSSACSDYLGEKDANLAGSGTIDHIAFLATDLQSFWNRLRQAGCEWRDRTVPSLGLHQVFVEDPSGVTIEINFPAAEAAALHGAGAGA
jgi:catechol 2,3-dioxygenase-like lactoylglutathione lyase family enzyme